MSLTNIFGYTPHRALIVDTSALYRLASGDLLDTLFDSNRTVVIPDLVRGEINAYANDPNAPPFVLVVKAWLDSNARTGRIYIYQSSIAAKMAAGVPLFPLQLPGKE